MPAISHPRTSFSQTAIVQGATFAACALLGVTLAYCGWVWLAPAAVARAPALAGSAGASSASGLFRSAKEGPGAAAASNAVRLTGVLATSEGNRLGHAVLRLDDKKTVAVVQGEEIAPGLRLAEVHADHVVVERNGVRETLAWPDKKSK